jgi:PAS domain S-box-containing protein
MPDALGRFNSLVEQGIDGVAVVAPDGLVQYVSPAGLRILNLPNTAVIGRPFEEFIAEDDLPRARSEFQRALEEGPVESSVHVRRRTGEIRVVHYVAHNRVQHPEVGGVVINFADVTEDARKFAAIFHYSPLALYTVHFPDRRIVDVNPAFEELTGYTPAEVAGRTSLDVGLLRDETVRSDAIERLSRGRVTRNIETEIRTKDGGTRWVLLSAHPLGEPSRSDHAVVAMADVSDRHLLEEQFRQSQKMEAVGRLAGGVAHDFNNLLTVILGFSEQVINHPDLPEDAREDAQQVLKAAQSAASLTRQLLAFSRRQTLQPKVVDINEIVGRVRTMLSRTVGEHIEVITALGYPLPKVFADPTQIEQILMNLAVNARDAMPGGGRLLISTRAEMLDDEYVRHHRGAHPGPHVLLTMSDTGAGMADEVKAHLFEPFFTTKEHGKGSGLGLATVYGIVKQSGGFVWVDTEPGRGATFQVYLPVTTRDGVEEPQADVASAGDLAGSERILIVEDQEDVRALVQTTLSRAGYSVLTAATSDEAVAVLSAASRVHLLITDVIMPRMGGRELASILGSKQPSLRVLYMSGYPDEAIAHEGVLDPGVQFIQKPFSAPELLRRVRQALEMSQPPRL